MTRRRPLFRRLTLAGRDGHRAGPQDDVCGLRRTRLGQLAYVGWQACYRAKLLAKAGTRALILRSKATILNAAMEH